MKPVVPESLLKRKAKVTSSSSTSNLQFFHRDRTSSGELEAKAGGAPRRRKVCVLLTGGTMAMRPRRDGSLAPSPGYLAAQMRAMPELREPRMPEYDVIEV